MRLTPSVPLLALGLACIGQPSAAQEARACANEVQRLSEAFSLTDANPQTSATFAQEPGAREGASLTDEQRKQIDELVQQGRTAGEQGDSERCIQSLTQARALLRQGGIGSAQPGTAFGGGSGTGSAAGGPPGVAGSGGSPMILPGGAAVGTTDLGTTGAGAVDGAGSTSGTMGGGTAGSSAGGSTSGGAGGSSGGGSP